MPQRTCIVCRTTAAKRTLVRLVRDAAGAVTIDPGGKLPGRGAYLCANRACWKQALRKGRLDQALRTTIREDDRAAIRAFGETQPDLEPADSDESADAVSEVTHGPTP